MAGSFKASRALRSEKYYSEHVYAVCNFIYGALNGQDGIDVADFVDLQKLLRPCKRSALHDFISAVIDFYEGEAFYDWPQEQLEANRDLLSDAELSISLGVEERIRRGDYKFEDKTEAYKVLSKAHEKILVPSVFHALFSDRNFILGFQRELRTIVKDHRPSELGGSLDSLGRIKRVNIPVWLKKGIFFRDRGQCQICSKDISGLRSPFDALHLDHIMPLSDYGNNDPSNFQLACDGCNLEKGVTKSDERMRFVPFW